MMDYERLQNAVTKDAAIRRRRKLQPAGGQNEKIFPPTFPGKINSDPPRHVYEVRKVGKKNKVCVLIDSVQSQANRLEEALLNAANDGHIRLPRIVVDFPGAGSNSVPAISSLEAPHRIFDAILRDSNLDGTAFRDSELGQALRLAKPHDASAILRASPTALLFGAWNSTGEGGGLGAKFARAIVSEIIAVDVPAEGIEDPRTHEMTIRTLGRRTGSRIDPLGILRAVEVYKSPTGWDTDQKKAGAGAKKSKPSEINHGNIAPSVQELGITCDHALQTCVITLAGLRRLRFGGAPEKDIAARAYLAALGLVALAEADAQGYALRSRCDLVCDGPAPLELVAFDGTTTEITLDVASARALHEEAYDAAARHFDLRAEPIILKPQQKLLDIIRASQNKALQDQGGEADATGAV